MRKSSATGMEARGTPTLCLRPRLLSIAGVAQVIPHWRRSASAPRRADSQRLAQTGVTLSQLEAACALRQQYRRRLCGPARKARIPVRHLSPAARGSRTCRPWPWPGRTGAPCAWSKWRTWPRSRPPKRGDAGYGGAPAVVLSVQKQPGADTVKVTRAVESALQELARPAGRHCQPRCCSGRRTSSRAAVGNVAEALRDGAVMVALVLFAFCCRSAPRRSRWSPSRSRWRSRRWSFTCSGCRSM